MNKSLHIIRKKILLGIMINAMLFSSLFVNKGFAADSWSKPRPSNYRSYDEVIGRENSDGIASVAVAAHIFEYVESVSGDDFLHLRVSASANTRVGIQYDVLEKDYDYKWRQVSDPTGITGDNVWVSLPLPYAFLFYGVEYNEVWVSDDGLLSFDSQPVDPPPQSIPSTSRPNSLIAPFWRDLNPAEGGSITYGEVAEGSSVYFVVSWNNVPNAANDSTQTFQVAIRFISGWGAPDYHNYIYFAYKSITKDYFTSVGVEDQVGNKGTSYDYNSLHNRAYVEFSYSSAGYRLEHLKIKLTKFDDSYAMISFIPEYIGGYNVRLREYENPFGDFFATSVGFVAGLLVPGVGVIWETMLIIKDTANLLSGDLSDPDLTPHGADEYTNEAYITGLCRDESAPSLKTFDSTLASKVFWWFLDPNDEDHSLTITAEARYQDFSTGDYHTISTLPVTLDMYIGPPELTVETLSIEGSEITDVKVWVDGNQFYSPVTVSVDAGNHTIDLQHVFWTGPFFKYTFQHWEDGSTENPRIVNVKSAFYATAYYNMTYEGTCPTLFVWNGSEYVYETLLDIHGDSDVTLQHRIEEALVPQKGFYKLSLRELDEFTSHIDYVKLHVVDSDDGEMHETHLTKAIHSELGDVKELLRRDDDSRVDLTPSQTIDLKFTVPNIDEVAYFIFEINGHNKKIP